MATPAALLLTVFPLVNGKIPTAGDLIQGFDFSKISVNEKSKEDYLHCELAPSFGKLNSETIKKLDDEMKIMILGLTKDLAKLKPEQRTWEALISKCAQNPLLAPLDDGVTVADSLIKSSSNFFKTDGSPDDGIVREVEAWFKRLIADEDIINSTKIDIKALGRIVAQTGATITSFENFFVKTEKHQKDMLDIGVLRYPDIDNPFFKIYRIKLSAWSDCTRTLAWQEDKNGIQLDYNMRRYKPRSSVIDNLKKDVKDQATKDAEDLLKF